MVGRARRTSGRDAADRGEYRQAAGAIAEAVIRSVELIVQPAASRRRLPVIALTLWGTA